MPSTGPVAPQKAPVMTLTVVIRHDRNLFGGHVLITRCRHLEAARQVGPKLKPVHLAAGITARHFLMQDPAAGGHPLHRARAQSPQVAQRIRMIDRTFEHIGDGFDPPVRMLGEAFLKVLRIVIAEIVKEQEGASRRSTRRALGFRVSDASGPWFRPSGFSVIPPCE